MGIIQEEISHPEIEDCTLMVDQRTKLEASRKWAIIDLDIDTMRTFTPKEIISLGKWLVEHGKRIKSEYTSSGHKINF